MNRRRRGVLAAGLCAFAMSASASDLQRLEPLQWRNRVIVAESTGVSAPRLAMLEANRVEIADRDIVWFVIDGTALHTNYKGGLDIQFAAHLRSRLSLAAGEAVLIGKDGGVKSRSADLDTAVVFALIDTMPMRQREMREQSASDD